MDIDELNETVAFMRGPDSAVFRRLIAFFSNNSRYCPPQEVKRFWESLTGSEKNYYRMLVATRFI